MTRPIVTTVIVTPEPEADRVEIAAYMAEKADFVVASRYTMRVLATVRRLCRIPLASGRLVPTLGYKLRCHPHGNHNIDLRYNASSDVLQVVRVLDGRRDINAEFFAV
jgi:plasmid stabilization system protein ParE